MHTCMSAQGITYLVTCESHVILAHVNHMLITCESLVILAHVNHM